MGLAASQARFLGITARKANCEFKSTELAEEKLNLSNQLSQISNEYFNALNATKLVWQNELTDRDYSVSYGLLMTPSAVNDYNPYMLTTKSGAIVLNSEYVQAAKAAGISMGGGVASQDGRDNFINALVESGAITNETAKLITIDSKQDVNYVKWNARSGVGGAILDKNTAYGMNISDLMMSESMGQKVIDWDGPDDIDNNGIKVNNGIFSVYESGKTYIYRNIKSDDEIDDKNGTFGTTNIKDKIGEITFIRNGSVMSSDAQINQLTIADLISDHVVVMVRSAIQNDGNKVDSRTKAGSFKDCSSEFADNVLRLMTSVFKNLGYGDSAHSTGLNIDQDSSDALDYAYDMIKNVYLRPSNAVKNGDKIETSKSKLSENDAYQNAIKNNRIGQDDYGNYSAVDLSNVISAFLTYYDNYLMGDSQFVVSKTVDLSSYVTESSSYLYFAEATDDIVSQEEKISDFYDELYNNLCARGWREDDTISNNENLEAAIKDGRYTLSALHDDGYFYQTNYINIEHLVEVADTEAIARAEADYTRKKSEITYKENSIDIKSKRLDAEIAELTTELNSVSSLIQEGVKVFNIFQN